MTQSVELIGICDIRRLGLLILDPFNSCSPQIVDIFLRNESGMIPENIAFSPSGVFLAGCSIIKSSLYITIWDMTTGGVAISSNFGQVGGRLETISWGSSGLIICTGTQILTLDVSVGNIVSNLTISAILGDVGLISNVFGGISTRNELLIICKSGRIMCHNVETGSSLEIASAFNDGSIVECATIHDSGLMFVGLDKGLLNVYSYSASEYMNVTLDFAAPKFAVQHIAVHPKLKQVAMVLKDKTIRIVDIHIQDNSIRVDLRHKLQDVVNRWPWNVCGFSHDGELIWGASPAKGQHLVYLWDSNSGALVKMLEGPREDLLHALWNPKRPCLITTSAFGTLLRWVPDYPMRWSALVPGLEELEENVEYIEREDEFDLTVEEELEKEKSLKESIEEDQAYVDVITLDPSALVIENVRLGGVLGQASTSY